MQVRLTARLLLLLAFVYALAGCGSDTRTLTALAPGSRILAFGDSLTYGTGAPAAAYPLQLSRAIGFDVVNAGRPGEVSADGARRLPGLLAARRPALVILIHGGNDTLRRVAQTETAHNIERMIEAARAHGAAVVLFAVPGANITLSPPDYYAEIAERMDVPIDLDTLPTLMRDRRLKSDAVHFNAQGYEALADAARRLLIESGALPSEENQ